eukprot:CAMPEP_0170749082 /NCGR_PEP_ID=MMETSP0437-20130122/10209_1 /TAXON_ID=0 /ORGANISM="Sexangularia sp." /LENGTH=153 /DNA_ID=CAMNT_0011087989 /DNA_START=17 /DNA_END=478 /DNA_ORIENTATION=-
MASLIQSEDFQHIIRCLNTNINGKDKIYVALTAIFGIGRRFSIFCCKKAGIDVDRRAGELSKDEMERVMEVVANPKQFGIPLYFLNRRRDVKTGKTSQLVSNAVATSLRDDIERLKKIRSHRGLRHYWNIKVRGQHTKTTGRGGRTVGIAKRK